MRRQLTAPPPARLDSRYPGSSIALFGVILLFFLVRNLPWHLDDYDQAKQAFVSLEMIEDGEWFYQHTPQADVASKPPLMGWLSAGLRLVGIPWDWAWRLPSLVSGLGLALLIYHFTVRMTASGIAGLLGATAFGINMLSPRLATLVRTDMVLCLLIAGGGLLILSHIHDRRPWNTGDRFLFGGILGVALMTKGPLIYLFLLPPLLVILWLRRREGIAAFAWSGWLSWLVPLVPFLIWAVVGISTSEPFYKEVVVEEFLARFESGEGATHRSQPVYFYFPHLIHKFLPWSIVIIVLATRRDFRDRLRREPALLWLVLWALVPLILMSMIPSKRVDRIYPVVPPLAMLAAIGLHGWRSIPIRGRFQLNPALVTVLIALIGVGAYTGAKVWHAHAREDADRFARFSREAREMLDRSGRKWAVFRTHREGLLNYVGHTRTVSTSQAARLWKAGELSALIVALKDLEKVTTALESPWEILMEGDGPAGTRDRFVVIARPEAAASTAVEQGKLAEP